MEDEIIAEVWRNRDQLAEKYGHDLDAIVAAMKKRESKPLTRIVRRTRRKPDASVLPRKAHSRK